MKYKLVIFDFDGTLADSYPWAVGIANDLAAKHRFKQIDAREQEMLRGYSAAQILKYLGVRWWKVPLIARDAQKRMAREIHRIPLFDGVDELFEVLQAQGALIAIVSSNSKKNIRQVLGEQNVARIKYLECGVSLFGKSAKINKLVKRSKVTRRETILIGDEIRDGQAARRAHIAFGAVTWGFTHGHALAAQRPNVLFKTMREIAKEVGRMDRARDAI